MGRFYVSWGDQGRPLWYGNMQADTGKRKSHVGTWGKDAADTEKWRRSRGRCTASLRPCKEDQAGRVKGGVQSSRQVRANYPSRDTDPTEARKEVGVHSKLGYVMCVPEGAL